MKVPTGITKRLLETGEMGRRDIEPGGEHYEWAQAIKNAAQLICGDVPGCSFERMNPFDVYQGPYADLQIPVFGHAKLWDSGEEGGERFYLEYYDHGQLVGFVGFSDEVAQQLADKIKAAG